MFSSPKRQSAKPNSADKNPYQKTPTGGPDSRLLNPDETLRRSTFQNRDQYFLFGCGKSNKAKQQNRTPQTPPETPQDQRTQTKATPSLPAHRWQRPFPTPPPTASHTSQGNNGRGTFFKPRRPAAGPAGCFKKPQMPARLTISTPPLCSITPSKTQTLSSIEKREPLLPRRAASYLFARMLVSRKC